MKFIQITLIILSSFGICFAQLDERILSFDVIVNVDKEADLVVRETIKVNAHGDKIKRGITRSLPTYRKDKNGNSVRIRYDIRSVKYDGNLANFFIKERSKDKVIYIGDKDVFIPHGQHTYEITYKTYNQVGFFDGYDEINWNVTGFEWSFPIDTTTATFTFPDSVHVQDLTCYTGRYGSKAQNCTYSIAPNLLFEAANLKVNEGLTATIAFTPGIINKPPPPPPPTFIEKFGFLILAIGGVFLLGAYYLFTWFKYGIDPPKPAVYPIYNSPENLSPAGVGSVHKDKVSTEFISASIINLAVKGYLKITEVSTKGIFRSKKAYKLEKLKPIQDNEPIEERMFFNSFFSSSQAVVMDGEYDSNIEYTVEMYKRTLNKEYGDLIEKGRNHSFLVLPILLILFIFIVGLAYTAANAAMNKYTFIGFTAFGISSLIAYKYFIERPLEEKLRLQSLIDGFKMYMSAAENHQIQNFNPPYMTPEVLEKLLPYAIALKADKVWGKKFQKYLASAAISNYRHGWYVGHGFDPNFYAVMNNTMRNTVAQSAVKPAPEGGGSDWGSGMGGGGFAGSGGGGGGGGGW